MRTMVRSAPLKTPKVCRVRTPSQLLLSRCLGKISKACSVLMSPPLSPNLQLPPMPCLYVQGLLLHSQHQQRISQDVSLLTKLQWCWVWDPDVQDGGAGPISTILCIVLVLVLYCISVGYHIVSSCVWKRGVLVKRRRGGASVWLPRGCVLRVTSCCIFSTRWRGCL